MILMAIFPTCVLIFFAYSLLSALKEAAESDFARDAQGGCQQRRDMTKPVTVRVIAVVVVFVVLESPGSLWQIAAILQDYGLNKLTQAQFLIVQRFTYFLGYLDSICNFYIYCLLGRRFRRSFKRLFSNVRQSRKSSFSGSFFTSTRV
jgi:membrane protease YdiL (CAAX protease family)